MKRKFNAFSGFTLLEMLVVMTLLSVMVLALLSAMRGMAGVAERIEQRLERTDEWRVAQDILTRTLGRVSVQKLDAIPLQGESPFLFTARPNEISWVGVMPARFGAGGRYFFRLSTELVGDRLDLILRFQPWQGLGVMPKWEIAESRPLVSDIASASFLYGDDRSSAVQWSEAWKQIDSLPTHVSLAIKTPQVSWPPLIIALRRLEPNDGGFGGFTVGGRK